jgi:glycosyltransferase involved in cell wall biosynthesis
VAHAYAGKLKMPARPRVDILNINFFDWDGVRAFTGGAERYVLDLARLLSALGMQPRLLQNARVAFEREVEGFEVVGIEAAPHFDLAAMSAGFVAATRDAALVIASPLELASRLGDGPPVIGINHGIWWDLPGHRATHPELSDHEPVVTALRAVAACVAVDTNFINWLRASGEAVTRVHYIPNYVDHARFRPVVKDFDAQRLEVLFPRRLCTERGFHETMRAFDMLWAEDAPCDLHLCGGGARADEDLARAFVARHPGRARWSEAASEDMPGMYGASHVVLVPTLWSEGTSLACLEAMATNNGVVATYVGGLPNLILDEVNGLLVEPGADALAAAVRRLLRDRRLLASIAARAQEVAATFTATRWQQRWSAVLRDVLPALRPAVEQWWASLPGESPTEPAVAEGDLAATRAALQDTDNGLRIAASERDGAYRAALVATFDRDAARREIRKARDERDAAMASQWTAAKERDAMVDLAAAAEARERVTRSDLQTLEREHTSLRERLEALLASRGVRWLRALDRQGRYLLPPAVRADEDTTPARATPSDAATPVDVNLRSALAMNADDAPAPTVGMRASCCGLAAGRVSVVLPVYNQADMVDGAIRSVLAQTYPHLELIVIDDGSTDALAATLAEFAADPRLRVVAQANEGLPRALSNGFALARGEYWTWTSADNLMGERQLELMIDRLPSAPEVGMVYADYRVIDDQGNPLADPYWLAHNRPDPLSNVVRLPRTTERLNVVPDNFIGPCFLYRGWIGRILGAYDGQQGVEDYDYWMRVNGLFKVAHLGTDDLLYWYRVHDNTLSARSEEERIPLKIERLMAAEQDRAQWNRLALVVHLDRELAQWRALRSMAGVVRGFDEPADLPTAPDGPVVVVASALRAASLAQATPFGERIPLVIAVDAGADIAEEGLPLLRRPHVLVVVKNAADAERIGTLTSAPIVDGESSLLGAAIRAFARHHSYVAREAR